MAWICCKYGERTVTEVTGRQTRWREKKRKTWIKVDDVALDFSNMGVNIRRTSALEGAIGASVTREA
jgi:hypothetical protein